MTPWQHFQQDILRGQTPPADLLCLFTTQQARISNDEHYADPFEQLGLRTLDPADLPSLLTHDYLDEEERQDPDIASNIEAIDQVFALCTLVASDDDSNLLGYWHGPQRLPIDQAPIVRYDTEGQFSLLAGRNLIEAIVHDWTYDDDEAFADYLARFAELGIEFSAKNRAAMDELYPELSPAPDELHNSLYQQACQQRGV